ncbi:MAG: bacillithiol biosynthesis cysteine-adding enzyme BshC [Bacteroidia bacterium]|nr:bacillithiol biosynthesis cysteine-adding enzyme BshC [Bacteroidia bacterium]MBT8275332.1 bacillithiol biosynthesis cysteine-adding enzyme BshC [Bacteroidia bacterium]NNJ82280.1 bacillithiol biosynthesis cysteine-adding enzyme BshC [Flavobacteriaceae bacterium]NNK54994.1 bacillithiol biosynthesis cysteine-adding enzyme BshC [Flavobacteriaceae bacterium]NNM09612.1 bacillithiol biosynthesis cysteine-adding enzyme BshC [Flavobacteriaceae bacterium]
MPIETIPYAETGYFSELICDYLAEKEALRPFYHRFPELSQFESQLLEKKKAFSVSSREILVAGLQRQYDNFQISETTRENIESLSKENTFTITTGHQLNLFTGPLYFLYKIFSVINLTEQLNKEFSHYHFVPVYWMASEDHDFDEINYFNFHGKKIVWDREDGGAVGDLSTEGLEKVLEIYKQELGGGEFADQLLTLFSEAYLKYNNLADATRHLGNELFKDHGLVIVDGNDVEFKKTFLPYAKRELEDQLSFRKVSETSSRLKSLGYQEQVSPREINLFYLKEKLRERIIEQDGHFHINNTNIDFNADQLIEELNSNPERFSPNALLRPLYQEALLPNLCYVGGGGELAYWLQLKDYFNEVQVPYPILLLRNSVMLISEKNIEKLKRLNVSISELFLPTLELENLHTHRLSEIEIDFNKQREFLKKQFEDMYETAKKTDASFLGAVAAQEKKQLNGLDKLEKRLLKAQRRKLADELERITAIQEVLFPGESLQERQMNFSEFYLHNGPGLLSLLKKELDALVNKFSIIRW